MTLLHRFLAIFAALATGVGVLAASPADAAQTCAGHAVTINGTDGADRLEGTSGRDVIHGRGGNDVLFGFGGSDIICGGSGHDEIYGGAGADYIWGGSGNDRLIGGGDNDGIWGGVGYDTAFGNSGKDFCAEHETGGGCDVKPTTTTTTSTTTTTTTSPPAGGGEVCDHRQNAILVPACGAFFGTTDRRLPNLSLAEQEATLGQDFGAVRIYKEGDTSFFNRDERRYHDEGRTLVVSWKITQSSRNGVPAWRRVANGEFDALIRRVARDIRDGNRTVLFSIHHEPEDNVPQMGSNADYRAMFRRVHSIMEPIAPRQLVWFVNYRGWSFGPETQIEAMYPGDDVLDWISWNPYNWWGCHRTGRWKSFEEQARFFYDWAREHHPNKPLMVGETGATEDPNNSGRKARWIRDMAESIQTDYPQIKGVFWFQHTVASGFCERDWQSSTSSINAIRAMARDPYFGG